ncbi:MAG: hypothetical protein ACI9M3_001375 [Bacteroidia bacterium]
MPQSTSQKSFFILKFTVTGKPQTFIFMSRTEKKFLGAVGSQSAVDTINCWCSTDDYIVLQIERSEQMTVPVSILLSDVNYDKREIVLDISTAIQLSKQLRTVINLAKEL